MDEMILILVLIFVGQILGSLFGIIKKPSKKMLCCFLAFAGAMMLGVSFLELIPEALAIVSYNVVLLALLVGGFVMIGIDKLIPHFHNNICKPNSMNKCVTMMVVGIALHNIPEGLAIGVGFALDPALGILIALGIAVQDIPENIATIVSVYGCIKKRMKSFLILVGTVFFELAGFLFGYFVLRSSSSITLGLSLAAAAGIMIYLSMEELIPAAKKGGNPREVAFSILLGIIVVLVMGLVF